MSEVTRETVQLAYRLILGYEITDENVIDGIIADTRSITHLRSRLMTHFDARRQADIMRTMEALYRGTEDRERAFDIAMEKFLSLDAAQEQRIQAILARQTDNYSTFHKRRFFDQLRLLAAVRSKKFADLDVIDVLDVGVMAVSGQYAEAVNGLRLHTCDHPRRSIQNDQFGSSNFYPADLEVDILPQLHPNLIGKFHVILFCEVLEHLRLSPREILADFKQLLAPGGIIYLTTPNGLEYGKILAYFQGVSPVAKYSRNNQRAHLENFIHVREYTIKELVIEAEAAGLKVAQRSIREYFHPEAIWPVMFMNGRSLLTMILEA
jgi:2-polyprenyl-3-methyl-5-hydroxy-6-metoxy-1,4-benzoquinol methylase